MCIINKCVCMCVYLYIIIYKCACECVCIQPGGLKLMSSDNSYMYIDARVCVCIYIRMCVYMCFNMYIIGVVENKDFPQRIYIYRCVYMRVCVCVCVCVCTLYIDVCVYVCKYEHYCKLLEAFKPRSPHNSYIHWCVCVCVCVCIYLQMCAYVCVNIYIIGRVEAEVFPQLTYT